jgi:hypothetical protein
VTDHDVLMLSIGLLLMVSNLVGAGFTVRRVRSRRRAAAEAAATASQPSISVPLSNAAALVGDNAGGENFPYILSDVRRTALGDLYASFLSKAIITPDRVRFGRTVLDLSTIREIKMWIREPYLSGEVRVQGAEHKLFELALSTASVYVSVSSVNISGILMLNQEIRQAMARRGPPKEVVVELDNAEVDVWTRTAGG